jgi:hypothetical protein
VLSFFTFPRVLLICIMRAVDCDAKLASRVSHASMDVERSITIPITPSVREETMAERIAWSYSRQAE